MSFRVQHGPREVQVRAVGEQRMHSERVEAIECWLLHRHDCVDRHILTVTEEIVDHFAFRFAFFTDNYHDVGFLVGLAKGFFQAFSDEQMLVASFVQRAAPSGENAIENDDDAVLRLLGTFVLNSLNKV